MAFSAAVVGSNIPAPLLPLYQERLGLSAFIVSALFVTYFVALVAMFVVMSRSHLGRLSGFLLPAAMSIGILGDLALWAGSDDVTLLFLGRALAGTCVGLATGSAATLAVIAKGDRGRTLAATGAIAGSLLGLGAAAAVAELLPQPMVLIYQLHALALVVIGILLGVVLWLNRRVLAVGLAHLPQAVDVPSELSIRRRFDRRTLAGLALGAAGWTVGGLAVGVLPSALRRGSGGTSLFVGILAAIVLLLTAWLSPHLARILGRTFTALQALAMMAAGAVLTTFGLLAGTLWPILLGCFLWGLGQGFCYAFGLHMLTRGLPPVEQGRRTSLYASTSYGISGVFVLSAGALSTIWGAHVGVASVAAAFVAWCLAAAVLGHGLWVEDAAVPGERTYALAPGSSADVVQRPFHVGARFSLKASAPSLASSEERTGS